ncbi:MAG: MFS transporter [Rhodospirillaceae bacterium]|nr:MFS transporter [Rhodospirillaceae bacterium]
MGAIMKILFFVILLDLMGIGVMNPIFPFIATRLGIEPGMVTLILAIYPISSFIAAPLWGRMSDQRGRRPILMISQVGAVAAYIALAFADNIWMLVLSRFIGGICAGNIGAAYAYITDITTNENRGKGMALVGGALSLGFIIGPMVGGLLAGGDKATADFMLVALFCAAMNFCALMGTVFFLPESLKPEIREKLKNKPHVSRWQQFGKIRARSGLLLLFIAALAFGTGGSVFESTFPLWGAAAMDFGPRDVGKALSFAAVVMVTMQLVVVQSKAGSAFFKRLGDLPTVMIACVIYGAGLLTVAYCDNLVQLYIAQALLPIGLALFNPNITSLVSKQAADTERGMVMGFYASWGSLARGAGPLFSGSLLQANLHYPFYYGVLAMAVTIALILIVRGKEPPQAGASAAGIAKAA